MLDDAAKADKMYKSGSNRLLEGIPFGIKGNVDCGDGSITNGGSPTLNKNYPKFASHLWIQFQRLSIQLTRYSEMGHQNFFLEMLRLPIQKRPEE